MNSKQVKLIVFILHILLGFFASSQVISMGYSYTIIVLGIVFIIANSNENEEVLLWTAYLVGSEVFLRMTGGLFFYEINKYSIIILLLLGLFVEKKRHNIPPIYIFYLLLLLLGIVFTNIPVFASLRKQIAFNLSGPFLLGISALYYYKRVITKAQLLNALYYSFLPVVAMISYIYFKTPDLSEIRFGGVANFTTSGGFGPNQVATSIGFAVFVSAAFLYVKKRITGFLVLDILVLVYFTYRGFLTFSRGGIMAAGIAILFFTLFMILGSENKLAKFFKYSTILLIMLLGVFLYTSNVTGGMLENRYTNKNARGIVKKDVSAGRVALFQAQIEGFYENPLFGIGVGGTKFYESSNIVKITSHDEMGRLISEHGLVGVFILFLLFFTPLPIIFGQDYLSRAFLIAFYLFWFLTINHSAMRVAFPGWIYGLCLINLIEGEEDEESYEEAN